MPFGGIPRGATQRLPQPKRNQKIICSQVTSIQLHTHNRHTRHHYNHTKCNATEAKRNNTHTVRHNMCLLSSRYSACSSRIHNLTHLIPLLQFGSFVRVEYTIVKHVVRFVKQQ